MVLLGGKSPKLKHVVCHGRYVYMLLKDANSHLNLTLTFNVEGFNYVVFVSSETMKCFWCGVWAPDSGWGFRARIGQWRRLVAQD